MCGVDGGPPCCWKAAGTEILPGASPRGGALGALDGGGGTPRGGAGGWDEGGGLVVGPVDEPGAVGVGVLN